MNQCLISMWNGEDYYPFESHMISPEDIQLFKKSFYESKWEKCVILLENSSHEVTKELLEKSNKKTLLLLSSVLQMFRHLLYGCK